MATFKAEVQNKRVDGTYNVRIRVIHNRETRRLSTHIFVTDTDLTRALKIKNINVLQQCEVLIAKCRNICNDLGYESIIMPIDDLIDKIKGRLLGDQFNLDFIQYTREKAADMNPGTASTYIIMLSALKRFIKRDHLDITEITTAFLRDFEKFIEAEPSQQGSNRKTEKKDIKPKSGRAVSAYIACVRAIHNKAKAEFNDEDRGLIRIPFSPFKNYKIKPQPNTRKRGLTPETIQAIIDLPYEDCESSRINLAKDCFIMSFALIGMNSTDMYYSEPANKKILIYNRRKTADRRDDKAEMRVHIDSCLDCLMERYSDPQGKRLFNFYHRYATPFNFNKALNIGLKQIGKILGVDRLEFYAARHSWATIASSSNVGIDKITVHEALNHVNSNLAITDIYIDRDWSVIWNANKKVLLLFDWSAVGYDVL